MIEVRGLSVSVKSGGASATLLDGVSLDVSGGEMVAVIGRNGAGKSTLCSCIAGIRQSYSGEVRACGRDVRSLAPRERARLVAYVPQGAPAASPYTVRDFVEMGRYPWRGASSRDDDERAVREAMELAGVAPLADRRLSSLSGGEMQRCMIAAAAAQCAPCVVLDEPTAYLDYKGRHDAVCAMAAIRDRGAAVIAVTHDINLALAAADRVLALAGGRAVWCGPSDELASSGLGRLGEVYGVPFERCEAASGAHAVEPVASLMPRGSGRLPRGASARI